MLRYDDQGITLGPAGIAWRSNGVEKNEPYGNIFSVRLQSGMVGDAVLYTCAIRFWDGEQLSVTSASKYGGFDAGQTDLYGKFVRDFHARIPQRDRGPIQFTAGNSEARQRNLWVVLVIAVLFFVGTPVVLLLITGDTKAFWLALTGVGLLYPLVRSAKANQPRNYRCEYLPADLVPESGTRP